MRIYPTKSRQRGSWEREEEREETSANFLGLETSDRTAAAENTEEREGSEGHLEKGLGMGEEEEVEEEEEEGEEEGQEGLEEGGVEDEGEGEEGRALIRSRGYKKVMVKGRKKGGRDGR